MNKIAIPLVILITVLCWIGVTFKNASKDFEKTNYKNFTSDIDSLDSVSQELGKRKGLIRLLELDSTLTEDQKDIIEEIFNENLH